MLLFLYIVLTSTTKKYLQKKIKRFKKHEKRYKNLCCKKINMKYIIVTGGVISGLGKGITASSIGRSIKMCWIECCND